MTEFERNLTAAIKFTGVLVDSAPEHIPAFRLKLTRGDGTVIDGTALDLTDKRIRNSDGDLIASTWTWNAGAAAWIVTLDDPNTYDPDGHWIIYGCNDGITTQYPYRYKAADQAQAGDRVLGGDYVDTIPYWVVGSQYYDPIPTEISEATRDAYVSFECPGSLGPDGVGYGFYSNLHEYYLEPDTYLDRKILVKSSVPYKITRTVDMAGTFVVDVTLRDQYSFADPIAWSDEAWDCVPTGNPFCGGSNPATSSVTFSGGDLNYECIRANMIRTVVEDATERSGVVAGTRESVRALNTCSATTQRRTHSAVEEWCPYYSGDLLGVLFGGKNSQHRMSLTAAYE